MKLKGKIALITGAGSGIGRASAVLFTKEGASVVVADMFPEGGKETAKIIRDGGGEATFVEAQVSKSADAEKMVRTAIQRYGKLDILFNNAGVSYAKSLLNTTEEEWDRTIDTNLKGVFMGSKYAVPEMIKTGGGVIINTASISGLMGSQNLAAYCASKGGVVLLTKAMACDLGRYNIRVNCICPAHVLTPMVQVALDALEKPEYKKTIISRYPLGRLGTAEDIASAALFLASDDSSWMSGSALVADAGVTAQVASLTEYIKQV